MPHQTIEEFQTAIQPTVTSLYTTIRGWLVSEIQAGRNSYVDRSHIRVPDVSLDQSILPDGDIPATLAPLIAPLGPLPFAFSTQIFNGPNGRGFWLIIVARWQRRKYWRRAEYFRNTNSVTISEWSRFPRRAVTPPDDDGELFGSEES